MQENQPGARPPRRELREPQTLRSPIGKRASERGRAERLGHDLKASAERMRHQGSSHEALGDSDVAAIVARAEMTIEGIIGIVEHIKHAVVAPAEERAAVDSLSSALQTLGATPREPLSTAPAASHGHVASTASRTMLLAPVAAPEAATSANGAG